MLPQLGGFKQEDKGGVQMHVQQEPAIAMAAALIVHWSRHDIEAAVLLLADIGDKDEAEDIITALLLLREKPLAELEKMLIA